MFGKSPQPKYNEYLTWFAEQVADQSNWGWMREDRDCANWQVQTDIDGNSMDQGRPIPYEYGEAVFLMSDPKRMRKALTKKVENNHQKYTQMGNYINGDPKQGLINQEYDARFENTKKLKDMMTGYMGSKEAASDELFRLAKQAEETGQDLSQVAKQYMDTQQGNHIVCPLDQPDQRVSKQPEEEQTKGSFASEFLHLLWKHGIQVDRFMSKKTELSVEVAQALENKGKK